MTSPRAPAPPGAGQPDYRRDVNFTWPDRQPWSVLGPQFAVEFGRADPADPQPEHIAVYGQNGSGKTHLTGKIYQERAYVTGRPSVWFVTKPVDGTMAKIGFPVANTWDQLVSIVRDGHHNVIYWPRTRLMGNARKRWFDAKLTDVLDRLWASATEKKPADTDVVIDDAAFAESLPETAGRIEQYLREGRSPGFSVGLLRQRPQGGSRLKSSETHWQAGFRPKDNSDLERWAELFGARQDWMPVLRSLNPLNREFVIRHSTSGVAYISWVDQPLLPVEPPRQRRGVRELLGF